MKRIIFLSVFIFNIIFIRPCYSENLVDLSVLSEEARSSNYLSKLFAIDLLGDVADNSYRNFFILALNNEKDPWIRYYAAQALSNMEIDNQILFELKKMLTDKENEPWLRKKIAEMLYKKTGKQYRYRDEKDAIVLYKPENKNIKKGRQKREENKNK